MLQGNELDYITFSSELINRPGLLLTGFEDYFGDGRVQVVGNAEYYYIHSLPEDEKRKAMERSAERMEFLMERNSGEALSKREKSESTQRPIS